MTLSAANAAFDGTVTVNAGTLTLGNTAALGSPSSIALAGGTELTATVDGVVIDAPITLGASGTTAQINTPGDGTTLTLNGAIGGDGNLTLNSNHGANDKPTIVLGGQSTYGGNTLITCNNGVGSGGNLYVNLAVADALPTTTVLTLDGGNGVGSGRTVYLDLNGHNQTLGGLKNVPRDARAQLVRNTSATGATLTVNNSDDNTFSGTIQDNLSLTKGGAGKLTLSANNSYTGDTSVEAGVLSITTAYLADAADVYLTTGAVLDLAFSGTDTIDQLFIDGIGQLSGTWGPTDSGADHESDLLWGNGLLYVTTAGSLPGDANDDGVVDAADYILVKQNFGNTGGDPQRKRRRDRRRQRDHRRHPEGRRRTSAQAPARPSRPSPPRSLS